MSWFYCYRYRSCSKEVYLVFESMQQACSLTEDLIFTLLREKFILTIFFISRFFFHETKNLSACDDKKQNDMKPLQARHT